MIKRNAKRMMKTLGAAALLAAMIPFNAYASAATTVEQTSLHANQANVEKAKTAHGFKEGWGAVVGAKWKAAHFPLQPALDLLGLDKESFRQAVKDGKSLADIAKEKGVSRQQLIDALTKEHFAKIDEAVKEGKLTQEEAEIGKAKYADKIGKFVDGKAGNWGHFKGRHGKFGVNPQPALDLLGLDKESFRQAVKDGKSLADIAEEKGVSRQQLIDALTKEHFARIDEAVKKGKLTQKQADERKAKIAEKIGKMVEKKHKTE